MKKLIVSLINIYQKTISPDHSWLGSKLFPLGYCPYEVSCSEYSKKVISKEGTIKGGWKAIKRIISCN